MTGRFADASSATALRIWVASPFPGVAGALLVPHQNVLDVALLENLVIDRQHRAAGIAEDMLDAMIDQRPHDHGSSGHLVRIVALVAHGLLRMRSASAASSVGSLENKKGPKRPHAHRPNLGWPQPSPAVRLATTTISSLGILLRIWPPRLPKGCARYSSPTREVKTGRTATRFGQVSGVFWSRRERKCGAQPCVMAFA